MEAPVEVAKLTVADCLLATNSGGTVKDTSCISVSDSGGHTPDYLSHGAVSRDYDGGQLLRIMMGLIYSENLHLAHERGILSTQCPIGFSSPRTRNVYL